MASSRHLHLVNVFAAGPGGGNPAPIVVDAGGISDADMQGIARQSGHECGFVLPAPAESDCDYSFRFWVPNHEMNMCGHVTIGAVWLLHFLGKLSRNPLTVWTPSGRVQAAVREGTGVSVEITQPRGQVVPIIDANRNEKRILRTLGITSRDLADLPIQNGTHRRLGSRL